MLKVLHRFGSVQFDPLAVAGLNHDLMLHARVAGYDPVWCEELYRRREIFEVTNKALSFVPVDEYPWFRLGYGRKGPDYHAQILAENSEVAEQVLGRIRAEGPLSARDFDLRHGAATDWFGMPENTVRAVLESLTVAGAIGLARREGRLRFYDCVERLLPADVLKREIPGREQLRHKLLSRYRAHGLLGAGGAGGTFARIGPPRSTAEAVGRDTLRKELVDSGALVPVEVDGVRGKRFVIGDEVALLEAPPEPAASVAFIAPFDSLLWDTSLLATLFGFEYVWEAFFPPARRRWGWYVLPVCFGNRFVGRIEPKIDRQRNCVEVLDVWWEDEFEPGSAAGFVEAMRDALLAYLRFADVERLEWAPHLTTEKKLFPGPR